MWNPIKVIVGIYQAYRWTRKLSAMLRLAKKLDAEGRTAEALDAILDTIDEALRNGRFDDCSKFLKTHDMKDCSPDILLAILKTTGVARSKIAKWYEFLNLVKGLLRQFNLDPEPIERLFDMYEEDKP